jgi:leader peptidase (prepilin peptidase)/N-methyltransferase
MRGADARSACPSCGHGLRLPDLVPLFSWLWLRGKCRYCKARIGVVYPFIELFSLSAALLVFLVQGFTLSAFMVAAFIPFLLALAVIDFQKYELPNQLMAVCAVLAFLYACYQGWARDDMYIIAVHGAAALLYGVFAWGTGLLMSTILKKDALGFGDVKFFAVAGLALGFAPLPVFMIISGVLGIVLGLVWRMAGRGKIFPFGPALIAGFYLLLVFT